MDFYQYYSEAEAEEIKDISLIAAKFLIEKGFKVLPCRSKLPIDKIRSVNKIRIKPLHLENYAFFFSDNEDIAILTGDTLEVIDIDCKYDLTGKMYRQVCRAIQYTLPDLWDKLVIQRTTTKGYHLFYRCAQIGGNQKLAQRAAIPEELAKGERSKILIETRGEGGYVMVSPTPGYEFIKGSPSTIMYITIDERAELMAILRSFNQLNALDLPGISKTKYNDPKAPWNQFNEQHGWIFIRDELVKAGWEVIREDDERIFVLRPGAASKSSGAIWKETNILFLFSTSTEFPEMKPISAFDIIRYFKFDGDVVKAAKGLAELGYGEFKKDEGEFYTVTDAGIIKHYLRAILIWMHDIGIRRYFINDVDFNLVHVVENKVSIIDNNYLKKIFCDYIAKTNDKEIDEYFLKKMKDIFSKDGLINLIERLDDNFVKSSVNDSWLFYENSAILITSTKVIFYEYNSIPGYVWATSIIKRKIYFGDTECEARKFIKNISGDKPEPFESAIGYMLHPFKDASNPKTIILNDEFFDESKEEREPEGGTGKGVFIKMLGKFRKMVIIDGKTWNNQKAFPYQQIGPETEIVAFEDVRRNFDFETLFSIVTDDWTIEKKNLGAFSIPFETSAKIIITSNYPLRGTSKSHQRRRFELEVKPYYNMDVTIIKEFGHRFFNDWSEKEWNKFDNYIIECIQQYLKENLKEAENINLAKSRLISETNRDFILWIEKQVLPEIITKEEFLQRFTDMFPDYKIGKRAITQMLFGKWVRKYCDWKNIKVDSSNQYNGKMCYRFSGCEQKIQVNDEAPF